MNEALNKPLVTNKKEHTEYQSINTNSNMGAATSNIHVSSSEENITLDSPFSQPNKSSNIRISDNEVATFPSDEMYDELTDNHYDEDNEMLLSHHSIEDNNVLTTATSHEAAMDHLRELEDLPQGRHMGVFSVIIMMITRIVGSGIFATPALIYRDVGGSPFLFFSVWLIAALLSFSGLYVFLELGSIVPRSGGLKVFLEYIYYKPKMFMSVVFNIYSIIFGFTITNAIIFGKYTLYSCGVDNVTDTSSRYVGCGFVILVSVIHALSVKVGMGVQNYTGALKLFLLIVMAFVGIYVLILPTSLTGIANNLHWADFFKIKREVTVSSFISALLKAIFSLGGWHSAHMVTSEIEDPVRTLRIAGPSSLGIINVCYLFINIAYLVVIPDSLLESSDELVGSLLFERIFGYRIGRQFLTFTIAASAAGNIVAVLYALSRVDQEIFREGFLPFSRFFSSNWPLGTPMRALCFPLVITCFFLLIPTPSNVYDYIINLESYPLQFFIGLAAVGIFINRRRYPDREAPIKAPSIGVIFIILLSIFLLIAPLLPKEKPEFEGFPNYAYTDVIILSSCALYWLFMFILLPRIGKYKLIQSQMILSDGLTIKVWSKQKL